MWWIVWLCAKSSMHAHMNTHTHTWTHTHIHTHTHTHAHTHTHTHKNLPDVRPFPSLGQSLSLYANIGPCGWKWERTAWRQKWPRRRNWRPQNCTRTTSEGRIFIITMKYSICHFCCTYKHEQEEHVYMSVCVCVCVCVCHGTIEEHTKAHTSTQKDTQAHRRNSTSFGTFLCAMTFVCAKCFKKHTLWHTIHKARMLFDVGRAKWAYARASCDSYLPPLRHVDELRFQYLHEPPWRTTYSLPLSSFIDVCVHIISMWVHSCCVSTGIQKI